MIYTLIFFHLNISYWNDSWTSKIGDHSEVMHFFFTGIWYLVGGGRNLLFRPRNLIRQKRDTSHNTVSVTNTFDIEQVYSLLSRYRKIQVQPSLFNDRRFWNLLCCYYRTGFLATLFMKYLKVFDQIW